jgi:hypothetical protein
LCAFLSPFAAAQGVGALGGTAVDASGAVLPGVTVTLSNPGTIGGNQEIVTNERGAYQFTGLVPGRYSVRAVLVGFRSVVLENIIVNADATTRADFKLEVGDVQESVTVSGQAALLDTTTALRQTVMSRDVIDNLPGRNTPWSIASAVPAVVLNKVDVGGAEAFGQSIASVHGSKRYENAYMIDGMDVGDANSTGYIIAYVDPFMYQEINYQIGNTSAENERGGVVYNMVTKSGTNVFHGSAMFSGANQGLQSKNLTPDLSRQLLAGVPAKVLAANPNLVPGTQILELYDTAGTLSGPIVRDKLWFTTAMKYGKLNQLRVGSYNPDGTQFVDDNRMKNVSFKISWQLNQDNQLHYTFDRNWKGAFHYTGNLPVDFSTSAATWLEDMKINIHQIKWTAVLSKKFVMSIGSSLQEGTNPYDPQPGVNPGAIPAYDIVTRTHSVANATYQSNPRYRGVVQTSLNYSAGKHELKAGYQLNRAFSRSKSWSMSNYPSGLVANYRNGVPDSVNTYNTPTDYQATYQENTVFVQDKWTPERKLTLNLGVRLEKANGWMPAECQVQTLFIDAQCFPEIKNVPDWFNVAARFALVYDLFGDGKTALKLGANRYLNGYGPTDTLRVNPIRVTSDTRSWTDLNGDGIPELTELGPSTGFNLGTTNRYSPTLQRPYTNELSVEVQRQLRGEIVISVDYYHRETRHNIGQRNLAVPADSYIPLNVTDVTSGRPVTVYNLNPALRGKFDVLWDNFDALDTNYNGVDVNFNKRFNNRWMLMSGLSLGRNVGDIYGESESPGDLNNPNFTFRRGLVNDVPVLFKASSTYQLPYRIMLSGTVQHFTGLPELTTVSIGANTVRLTQVTQSLVVEPSGTARLPDVNLVDLSVRKNVRTRLLSFEPVLDFYNVTNANTIQGRTTQLGPTYGQPTSVLRGRLLRLGVNVNF